MPRLRVFLLVLAGFCGLLAVLGLVLAALGVAIPLGPLRGDVERALAEATGREVGIGRLGVVLGAPPRVVARDLRIASPEGFEGDLIRIGRAHLDLVLRRLLDGEVHVTEVHGSDASLWLQRDENGAPNWELPPAADPSTDGPLPLRVDVIELRDLELRYGDLESPDMLLHFEEVDAEVLADGSGALTASGSLADERVEVSLQGAAIEALLSEGAFPIDLQLRWGEFAAEATATLDPSRGKRCLALSGNADSVDAGILFEQLLARSDITGSMRRLDVELTAPCRSGHEFLLGLDAQLDITGGSLVVDEDDGPGIDIELGELALEHRPESGLQGTAGLELLGGSLTLQFESGALGAWGGERPWPFELVEQHARGDSLISGALGPGPDDVELSFATHGQTGAVWHWLATNPEIDEPFRIEGTLARDAGGWTLRLPRFEIGRSRFDATVRGTGPDAPIAARIHSEVLAPAELETILRANGGAPERAPTEIAIDAPILPHKLVFHEIDLEATVARFEGEFTQITDVATKVSVRHHEARGSLRAQIAEQLFEGRAALELSRADARVSADVKAADVDLGQLLARLGLVADLEAHVGGLSARWQVEGRSLRRWADTTRLDVTLDDGTFHLYDPGSGSIARIVVEQGRAGGTWHDPTTAVIEGTLDEVPIQLHVETESIRELANPDDALDLRFGLDFAEAHAELVMTARAPLRYQRLDGTLEIAGERLDKLGFLLDLDIPIAKPYSARGRFDTGPGGYRLRDATVRVGESELEGAVTLKTTREPPYLEADLHSPTIRLDDFLREKTVADPTGAPSAQEASPQRVPRKKLEPLISEAFLRSLDAAVDVEVDQVSLGGEPLGAGILQLRIEDGRLDVDPAEMKFESAQAKGLLHCAPGSRGLVCRLAADVERADFGAVARWLDPDSEFEGSLELATELTYLSVPHEQIMPYATGELSVRVWPTKLSAGVIDLWSTTLLLAVLPALGIAESSVNCLVGDFVIDDGVMHPDRLVLDTTRTRVFGEGEIDLRRGWLDLLLRPVAKRTQLLSLETPLTIRGPIADLRTRTNARSLVGTLFHMTTSVVTAPLNLLFATPPPRDGSDVCGAGVARNG